MNRNYWVVGFLALSIMAISFVRIPLYPLYENAFSENNYLIAGLLSFFLANPYPLIPYLAYGLFGALMGMLYFDGRKDLLKKLLMPLGVIFIVIGVIGAGKYDKSISQADGFWYFKTHIELGLFLLLTSSVLLFIEGRKFIRDRFSLIKWFSRLSLTIYLFETLLSEVTRVIYGYINPGWDETINGSLGFGLFNVIVWACILSIWSRYKFKYSLEYFWVKFHRRYGKESTKLDP